MIAIIDYGMGNLRSVQKALERVAPDCDARIVARPDEAAAADKLILPGVGAFADAMTHLRQRRLVDPVLRFIDTGRPFLGICLGMQLLLDTSEEDGEHTGLGVIRGRVVRFRPTDRALKVPHMGWNTLILRQPQHPLLAGLPDDPQVYFVHSYLCRPDDPSVVAADADYGGPFCAALARGNVFAAQFHPEKSQRVGLRMLANFARL